MTKLLLCAAFALSLAAQPAAKVDPTPKPPANNGPKPTPITDRDERLKLFDMFAEGEKLNEKTQEINSNIAATQLGKERSDLMKQANDIQDKINKLNAKIQDTALGKEIGEIDLQMGDLRKRFNEATIPILAAHNCVGGLLTQGLELRNCPATSQPTATK